MAEPVSLDQVKTHLSFDDGDTSQDAYLVPLITAARRACELRINRSVIGRMETLELDQFPHVAGFPLEAPAIDALAIHLPGGTIQSVDSITYRGEGGEIVTLDPDAYREDISRRPGRVLPVGRWPTTSFAPAEIKIFYTVSPLEADDLTVIGQAMLLLIEGWYTNRGAVAVDVRGTPAEVPLAVTWLLWPLRQFDTD